MKTIIKIEKTPAKVSKPDAKAQIKKALDLMKSNIYLF